MVTFDEMRKDLLVLKQKVEKLETPPMDFGGSYTGIVCKDIDVVDSLFEVLHVDIHEGRCFADWVDRVINMVDILDQNYHDLHKKFLESNAATNNKLAELEKKINGVDTALEKQYSRVRVDIESNKAEVGNTVYHMDRDRATLMERMDKLADRLTAIETDAVKTTGPKKQEKAKWVGANTLIGLIRANYQGDRIIIGEIGDAMCSIGYAKNYLKKDGTVSYRYPTKEGIKSGLIKPEAHSNNSLYNASRIDDIVNIIVAYKAALKDYVSKVVRVNNE